MSPTTRWCHSCIFSSRNKSRKQTGRIRFSPKLPLFVEDISSRWCFNTHGWNKSRNIPAKLENTSAKLENTPAKLENIPADHRFAKMCFVFVHCQGTAKHKLTFGNLRFFSKGNCSSKNQENNFASEGAVTQFAMGKLSLLYFTNLNQTCSQFLKASLNCWTTFWADVPVSVASCTQNGQGSHWRIEFASLRLAIIKMFYS